MHDHRLTYFARMILLVITYDLLCRQHMNWLNDRPDIISSLRLFTIMTTDWPMLIWDVSFSLIGELQCRNCDVFLNQVRKFLNDLFIYFVTLFIQILTFRQCENLNVWRCVPSSFSFPLHRTPNLILKYHSDTRTLV